MVSTIYFETNLSKTEKDIITEMLHNRGTRNKGYKIEEVGEEDFDEYNLDDKERDFIKEHNGLDFYMVYDCRVWATGQPLSLIAVEEN